MEKISGIVPKSARVQAVDLKNSAPVRPGMPTFGRPVGTSTPINRDAKTTAERAVETHRQLQDARRSDEWKSEIARDLADKFFKNKTQMATPQTPSIGAGAPVASAPEGVEVDDVVEAAPEAEVGRGSPVVTSPGPDADLDAPEVGRYLDVTA